MGIGYIPVAIKNMDGIFGCKVEQAKGAGRDVEFVFRKKTLYDVICEFFSKSEMEQSRATAVKALRMIVTGLGDSATGELKALVKGYESNTEEIDFKKVRKAIKSTVIREQLEVPPIVFSEKFDANENLLRYVNRESNAVQESREKSHQAGRSDLQGAMTYRARDNAAAGAPVEKSGFQEFDKQWPARQDLEIIYRERLGASIRDKTCKIEIFRDPDGIVSDGNLAVLAETMIEVEKITKMPFSVSIDEEDDEKFRVMSARLESACLDYVADNGKPSEAEPEQDFEKLKSDLSELAAQYDKARLYTRMPSTF